MSSDGPDPGVFIISTDCMRCGVCEHMCPVDAIQEAKRQLIILKRVCTGCGDCVPYCPVHAIVPAAASTTIALATEIRAFRSQSNVPGSTLIDPLARAGRMFPCSLK